MSLDFQVGDFVQVSPKATRYAGRVGKIIGSRYAPTDNFNGGMILYTIQFSDKEAAEFDGMKMRRVKREE